MESNLMKSESYPNVIGIGMYFTAKNWGGGELEAEI